MSYQIYANGNREFSSDAAKAAASVAVAWKKQGHEPKAWSVFGDPVKTTEVAISTVAGTAKALKSA
jgi:hypothetical protein